MSASASPGRRSSAAYNLDIRYDRIKPLIDWSREQFPGMTTDRVVAWCGLRPMMPDMMPRVGPGPSSRRVLPHRPWSPGLDLVGGDRADARGRRRESHAGGAAHCCLRSTCRSPLRSSIDLINYAVAGSQGRAGKVQLRLRYGLAVLHFAASVVRLQVHPVPANATAAAHGGEGADGGYSGGLHPTLFLDPLGR